MKFDIPCGIFFVVQIGFSHLLNYKTLIPTVAIVAIMILGSGFYLYQTQKNQVEGTLPAAVVKETREVVREVGKLIELPQDEEPIIYPVTDIAALQDQPFFKNAKNGDKVLIYTKAAKAILFDPVIRKVIDVAPITIGTASAKESIKETLPKIILRNGTETLGLTKKIETKLKGDGVKFETVSKENAEKQDYKKTIIIVINESSRDLAKSIANVLEASISALPQDEKKADDVDIIVILGKDAALR